MPEVPVYKGNNTRRLATNESRYRCPVVMQVVRILRSHPLGCHRYPMKGSDKLQTVHLSVSGETIHPG